MILCYCILIPVQLICLRSYEHERDRRLLIQKKIDELNMFMKQCAAPDAKHPCLHLTLFVDTWIPAMMKLRIKNRPSRQSRSRQENHRHLWDHDTGQQSLCLPS